MNSDFCLKDRFVTYKLNMGRSVDVRTTLAKAAKYIGENALIYRLDRIDEPIRGIDLNVPVFRSERAFAVNKTVNDTSFIQTEMGKYTHSQSAGKGQTVDQALASCICEALERISAATWDRAKLISASYESLKEVAILPDRIDTPFLPGKPPEYYQQILSSSLGSLSSLYQPFREDLLIDWVWGYSLLNSKSVLVPAAGVYIGFIPSPNTYFCNQMNTNGISLGNNLEEAILQGFYEVIERDAIMIFFRAPVALPDVNIETFESEFIHQTCKKLAEAGVTLVVKDLSTDFNIPVFCAQIFDPEGDPSYLYGFGAHLDPEIALIRAISEVVQGRACYLHYVKRFPQKPSCGEQFCPPHEGFLENASRVTKSFLDYDSQVSSNLREDIETCINKCNQAGMDLIIVNLGNPDIDFSVVKVIVVGAATCDQKGPPIYLSQRVIEVPFKLGYIDQPLTISDLYLGGISL